MAIVGDRRIPHYYRNATAQLVMSEETIACDVFRSVSNLNAVFMHAIIKKTIDLSYQVRDSHAVFQPKFDGI